MGIQVDALLSQDTSNNSRDEIIFQDKWSKLRMECKSNGQHTNRTLCRSFAKIMRVTPNQRNTCKTSKTGYVLQNVGDERGEQWPKRPRGITNNGGIRLRKVV